MAKILVVDDQPINRHMFTMLLSDSGHTLVEATDGAEGLEKVRSERPALAIVDILLPSMDGYEFAHRLRSDPATAGTRVVLCTASYHNAEIRSLAEAYGVSHVITKPCEPELILKVVNHVLDDGSGSPASSFGEFDRLRDKRLEDLGAANRQLSALLEAGQQLASVRDPIRMLEDLCAAARDLVGARYASVVLLNESRITPCRFLVAGVDAATAEHLGWPALDRGVLSQLWARGRPLRVRDISADRFAAGLPPPHLSTRSFLGAQIASANKLYGMLCLVEKLGAEEFSEGDERVIASLAGQAAVAYENAQTQQEIRKHTAQLQHELVYRRQAEDQVRREKQFSETVINSSMDGIVACDQDFRCTLWNRGMERMTGVGKESCLGRFLFEVFPFLKETGEDENLRAALEGKSFVAGDRPFRVPESGREGFFEAHYSPLRNESGELIGALGIIRDITEQKRTAQELRSSDERFRQLVEHVQGVFYISAPDLSHFLYISPAYEEIWRRGCEGLYANPRSWQDCVYPEDLGRVKKSMRALPGGELNVEFRIVHPDGSIRWIWDRAFPVRDQDGRVVRVVGIAEDITERKRAEEEAHLLQTLTLEVSSAEDLPSCLHVVLREVCEATGWLLGQAWVPSADRSALECSPAWYSKVSDLEEFRKGCEGFTFAPGVGLPGHVFLSRRPAWLTDITSPEVDCPRTPLASKARLKAGMAIPVVVGDEVLAVLEFFVRERREEDERLLALISSVAAQLATLMQRKRAERDLRHLSGRLLQLQDEERRRIARDLHDTTGQNLAALEMNLCQINEAAARLGSKTRRAFTSSIALVRECVQEIRTASYLLHPPLLDEMGLASALRAYADGYKGRTGVTVSVDVSRDLTRLPSEVEIALFRVAQEALTNIHRHSGSPRAMIRALVSPTEVVLEVRDEGRGILPEVRERMANGSAKLGVGIAGMRERLRQLGGWLEVYSNSQGTTVRAVLPVKGVLV
ncbi:MAG TPA: PAS domain S-box protein [Terriglobales bacterium]|nr:PAS domain S-box protein [Terriglobales bacterium]